MDGLQITTALQQQLAGLMPQNWDLSSIHNVIWVSPDGYDQKTPGVGSYDTPYLSINFALKAAEPGTVVMLMPGTYIQNVLFSDPVTLKPISGTDTAPILLMSAEGPESTIITSKNPYAPTIWASGSDNIGIVGITAIANGLLKNGKDISGIKVGGNDGVTDLAQHILIANNIVGGSGYDGIKTYAADDVFVIGNTIRGVFGEEGFDNVTTSNATFAYNQTEGYIRYSGLTVKFASENIEVYGNRFEHDGGRAIQAGGFGDYAKFDYYSGKYTEYDSLNVNIHGNYISVGPVNYDIKQNALDTGLLTADNSAIIAANQSGLPIFNIYADRPETWPAGEQAFGIIGGHNTTFVDNFINQNHSTETVAGETIRINPGTNGESEGGLIDNNKIVFVGADGSHTLDLAQLLIDAEQDHIIFTDNNNETVEWDHLTGPQQVAYLFDILSYEAGTYGNGVLTPPLGITMSGSTGNDALGGTMLADTLDGGKGNDTLTGYEGADSMRGGDGDDILSGNRGNDVLNGGAGNDTLYGGTDHDLLNGGGGNDRLVGDEGNDTIRGGDGNDTIEGSAGNNLLLGNTGSDTFYFNAKLDSSNIITDYQTGETLGFSNLLLPKNAVMHLDDYLHVLDTKAGITINVDRDGGGAAYNSHTVVTLNNYHDVESVKLALVGITDSHF